MPHLNIEYEEEEFDKILDLLADGEPRYKIFDNVGGKDSLSVPRSVFNRRLRSDSEFYDRYLTAIEFASDSMSHDLMRIADRAQPDEVSCARLQVDVRKFNISRADMLIENRKLHKDAGASKDSELLNYDKMGDISRDKFMEFMNARLIEMKIQENGNE